MKVKELLGNKKFIKHTLDYVEKTKRFE